MSHAAATAPGTALPTARPAGGHTRQRLLGRTLAQHPILLAPVAYQRMAHPDGELATAHAAAAQGAGMVLSMQASVPLDAVARVMLAAPRMGHCGSSSTCNTTAALCANWCSGRRGAGYEALVLTVDAPVHGARDRERRCGISTAAGHVSRQPVRHPASACAGAGHRGNMVCATGCSTSRRPGTMLNG